MTEMIAVKERPILFSDPMVRAILDGRKTQTRRAVKPQPRPGRLGPNHPTNPSGIIGKSPGQFGDGDYCVWEPPSGPQKGVAIPWSEGCWYRIEPECPHGQPGDRLWVRETWAPSVEPENHRFARAGYTYRADWDRFDDAEVRDFRWKPSIYMPRRASRITLEIAEVRVERLQEIDHRGCVAEGWPGDPEKVAYIEAMGDGDDACIDWYADLWNSINGKGSWDLNPFVWVISSRWRRVHEARPARDLSDRAIRRVHAIPGKMRKRVKWRTRVKMNRFMYGAIRADRHEAARHATWATARELQHPPTSSDAWRSVDPGCLTCRAGTAATNPPESRDFPRSAV